MTMSESVPFATATQDHAPSPLSMFDRAMYRAQQDGLRAMLRASFMLGAKAAGAQMKPPPREAVEALERRYAALLAADLAHVEQGDYPRELLFQLPVSRYLRRLPEAALDAPKVMRRVKRGKHDDLPAHVDLDSYPSYYRRTFHWQTDGWLSERSARLYDMGVELLFGGTADIMRRMTLPPLVKHLRGLSRPKVLDVACGTGRLLHQLHRALPSARLYGLDLSPYYVAHARRELAHVTNANVVAENAEAMPFASEFFDAVSSVFLFHELPKDARRNVVREALRVLKPGGLFVVCDSAQLRESAELVMFLERFQEMFHEPYYKGYVRDDLETMLEEGGFEVLASAPHFLSKVVVCKKPSLRD